MCTRWKLSRNYRHHVRVRGVVARKLRSVRFLRRSEPEAEPAPAQAPPDTVRVGGKGRPTPKRRDAEAKRRGPAPPPPRTQREASKLAKANRPSREDQRAAAAARREGMARGDDRYLLPRDRGPVKAYIRDVVDSRPHIMGLFMPLALVVLALGDPAVPVDAAVPQPLQPDLPRHDGHRGRSSSGSRSPRRCGRSSRTKRSRASRWAGTPSRGRARSASSACRSRGSRGAPTPEHTARSPRAARSRGSITRNVGLDARARRHAVGQVRLRRGAPACERARPLRRHGPARPRRRRVGRPASTPTGPGGPPRGPRSRTRT